MTDTHKPPSLRVEYSEDGCCAQCKKNKQALGQLIVLLAQTAYGVLSSEDAKALLRIIED